MGVADPTPVVEMSRLSTWRMVAAVGGGLGLLGFLLPWFGIYGRPRSGIGMILGSGDLARHATPTLLTVWAAILGLIFVAVLAGTYLTLAPAWRGTGRPRLRVLAAGAGTLVCALLLVLGLAPGLGFWATFAGAGLLTLGNMRADGIGPVAARGASAT